MLHYDNLGQRPQGTLGHYMTYSGLLMLVIGTALARVLFGPRPPVGRARHARAGRRDSADIFTQRRGRRLRGGRAAPVLEGSPISRGAADLGRCSSWLRRRASRIASNRSSTSRIRIARSPRDAARGRAHDQGPSAAGHRPEHGEAALRAVPRARRRQRGQPAPAQRAAADRRGTRIACARHLVVVYRGADRRAREDAA